MNKKLFYFYRNHIENVFLENGNCAFLLTEEERKTTSYGQQIIDSWDMKLWWPHSEALYATLFVFEQSGDNKLFHRYKKIENMFSPLFPIPILKVESGFKSGQKRKTHR